MHTLGKLAAVLLVATLAGHAAVAKEVRIGLLPDLDGPYADISGKGVVEAARMALEDTKDRLAGWQVDVVSADSQGKPDVASAIVQHWFDEDHVDVIAGVPNSGSRWRCRSW